MPEGREIIEGPHTPGRPPTPTQEVRAATPTGASYRPEGGQNITQVFALVVGIAYLAIGVIGFAATGFTGLTGNTGDALLGFDLNIFHNVVHLAIGLGFIAVSRLNDARITQGVVIGGGLVYLLAAILGFIDYMQILSIDEPLAADNFLHLFSGAAAVIFGILGVRQTDAQLAHA